MGSGIPLDRHQETCDGWSIRIVYTRSRILPRSTRTTAPTPDQDNPVPPVVNPRRLEEPTAMLHFSCDICGKDLDPEGSARYVVKMEAFAATDPAQLTDDDLDTDHVEEMAQLLNEIEDGETTAPKYCRRPRNCGSISAPCATASSSRTPSAAKPPPD